MYFMCVLSHSKNNRSVIYIDYAVGKRAIIHQLILKEMLITGKMCGMLFVMMNRILTSFTILVFNKITLLIY